MGLLLSLATLGITVVNFGLLIYELVRKNTIGEELAEKAEQLMKRAQARLDKTDDVPPSHTYAFNSIANGSMPPICTTCHEVIANPGELATAYGADKLVIFHATVKCAPFLDLLNRVQN